MPELQKLCRYVSEVSYRQTPVSKPISGANVCRHESGIHCRSLLHNELSYQPFKAEEIGRQTEMVIGKHSGKAAISDFFRRNSIELSEAESIDLTHRVKRFAAQNKRALSDGELFSMVNTVKNNK